MIGDAVITPAISILSAVEGVLLIPGFETTSREILLIAAAIIAICLFIVQKNGVEKVASAFGPIMIIWFYLLVQMLRIIVTRRILEPNTFIWLKKFLLC